MGIDLEKLSNEIESISDKWNTCFGLVKTVKLDVSKNIPSLDMTLDELNEREVTIFDFIGSFELSEESSLHLISPSIYKKIMSSITAIHQNLDTLETNLKNIKSTGGVKTFDSNSLNVVCLNGQNVSIQNEIEQINKNTDQLLIHNSSLFSLVEVQYSGDLTSRNVKLQELYDQYKKQIDLFEGAYTKLEEKIKRSNELKKQQDSIVQASEKLKADIDNIQKEAVNYQAEVKAKVGTINEIATQADVLKKRVNDYQTNFSSFDKQ